MMTTAVADPIEVLPRPPAPMSLEEAGLSLDLPATLDGLTGVTFDPRLVWRHLSGQAQQELYGLAVRIGGTWHGGYTSITLGTP